MHRYLLAYLLWQSCVMAYAAEPRGTFSVEQKADRFTILYAGKAVAEYVFQDPIILRPYFANVCTLDGIKVTRNHPPIEGKDAMDHHTMHPGISLGFGDLNGQDFWRNKAVIRHLRFVEAPAVVDGELRFVAENSFIAVSGEVLAKQRTRFGLGAKSGGWFLTLDSEITPEREALVLGDQEEMGLAIRVATSITEKNGGVIVNSDGTTSARQTWGKPAKWCDYSGKIEQTTAGLTLMPHPGNFRESWWHNRDYGVFVANAFGRKAMKQGEVSRVEVKRGETFRLRFGIFIHGPAGKPELAAAYEEYARR